VLSLWEKEVQFFALRETPLLQEMHRQGKPLMSVRIYIVVLRTLDLPDRKLCMTSGRIASHAVHAAVKLQRLLPLIDVQDQDIIILSVAGSTELKHLCQDLNRECISFVEYRDIDRVFEGERLTAIAVYPVEKNQSHALKVLRPWKCACNETSFPRSSVAEQSVDNREVASGSAGDSGSIPAVGAS
jgi:hypothetical protein